MKKALILITFLITILTSPTAGASNSHRGLAKIVGKEEAVIYLTKIVKQFDEHAREMGGAGFFYGVKSKLKNIFFDFQYDKLENLVLKTPEYMLSASGISEDDPALGRTFMAFCRMMPTVYDTYDTCRLKIVRAVKAVLPGKSDEYYNSIMRRIRSETGAEWICL